MGQLGGAAATVRQRVEDNAFHLQFRGSAYELASTQGEPPGIMRGARDTDSRISNNVHSRIGGSSKTVLWIHAQIHLVVATGDPERLR